MTLEIVEVFQRLHDVGLLFGNSIGPTSQKVVRMKIGFFGVAEGGCRVRVSCRDDDLLWVEIWDGTRDELSHIFNRPATDGAEVAGDQDGLIE